MKAAALLLALTCALPVRAELLFELPLSHRREITQEWRREKLRRLRAVPLVVRSYTEERWEREVEGSVCCQYVGVYLPPALFTGRYAQWGGLVGFRNERFRRDYALHELLHAYLESVCFHDEQASWLSLCGEGGAAANLPGDTLSEKFAQAGVVYLTGNRRGLPPKVQLFFWQSFRRKGARVH